MFEKYFDVKEGKIVPKRQKSPTMFLMAATGAAQINESIEMIERFEKLSEEEKKGLDIYTAIRGMQEIAKHVHKEGM